MRAPPPGTNILVFVKTKHWEKKDTKLMIFFHTHAKLSTKLDKCEESLAFRKNININ